MQETKIQLWLAKDFGPIVSFLEDDVQVVGAHVSTPKLHHPGCNVYLDYPNGFTIDSHGTFQIKYIPYFFIYFPPLNSFLSLNSFLI